MYRHIRYSDRHTYIHTDRQANIQTDEQSRQTQRNWETRKRDMEVKIDE